MNSISGLGPRIVFIVRTARWTAACGFAVMWSSTGLLAQNLFTNPSFEFPAPPAPDSYDNTPPSGWSTTFATYRMNNYLTSIYLPATDGVVAMSLHIGGSVSQAVTLVGGQGYQVTFDVSSVVGYYDANLHLTITNGSETFNSSYNVPSSHSSWVTSSYLFTPSTNSAYTFTFSTGSSSGQYADLDRVSLTAIPEPATTAAVFGAIAVVGAALVRRKRLQRSRSNAQPPR